MVDRFDADYPYSKIETALNKLSAVNERVTAAIIKKAGDR